MPALSILIIDSSKTFSKAAQFYLLRKTQVEAVEIALEANYALQIAGRLQPDIILIDIKILTESYVGQQLCAQFKRQAPGAIIMILTLFGGNLQYPDFPEIDLISGFIAKEYFAETILPLVGACCLEKVEKGVYI
jgi:CheY-like chemotaxis protein